MKKIKSGILFLWLDSSQFHAQMAKERGISVEQTYKNMNKFEKVFRNIQITLDISSVSYWLNSWKENLDNYHTVIVHASILTPAVVKYIRNMSSSIRIIVWYWNPVSKSVNISKFEGLNAEIWVFDEKDAEEYSLNYNTQYYFNNVKLPRENIKYDISFIGGDKGRIEYIDNLNNIFSKLKLSTYFHVVETNGINKKYSKFYRRRIEYDELLNIISQSKVILDIVSEGQTGLTLRPLEALFLEKKLITNDKSIINRDFYTKENIFILDIDNFEELPYFVNSPYKKIKDDVVNKYDFDNWLKRFFRKYE